MITAWSRGASARGDAALTDLQPAPFDGKLPIEPGARFQRANMSCPGGGALLLEIACPRPLRLWLDGQPILDEPLSWRFYQRKMRVVALAPAREGSLELLAEFGERPGHPSFVTDHCPSRNRTAVMAALYKRFPEVLEIKARLLPGLVLPPFSLRFTPTQFHHDGVTWQEIQGRMMPDWRQPPTSEAMNTSDTLSAWPLIKGFQRAGRLDLAREIVHRHLEVMGEVLRATGHIWENYCSEQSTRGSWSTHDYSWTAVGPVALLMEVVLGLEPDAVRRCLRWTPPAGEPVGVDRFPLGSATIRLEQQPGAKGDKVVVDTDRPFTLELAQNGKTRSIACAAGRTQIDPARKGHGDGCGRRD